MAEETQITIVGNAVEDVELRFTPAGVAVAKFRIASTPRIFDKQEQKWRDGEGLFLKVVCWRQLAESVAESIEKGTRVIVQGVLKPDNYVTKEGDKRFGYQVEASEVGPSLKFATAKVQKMSRSGGGGGSFGGGQPAGDDPWSTGPAPTGRTAGGSNFDEEPPF
ncbi:single-stranded DNA-binding protein [Melissospora conviva]|uniref:single-stranded DNA-binding protein n=1 Tax=Melissospora conviva TaxID=3388432 RepID=UPI003C251676